MSEDVGSGAGEQWRGSMLLREQIQERGSGVPAHRHTGLVDEDDAQGLLNAMVHAYDPQAAARAANRAAPGDRAPYRPEDFPPTVEQTEAYQMLLGNESTATLSKAIHEGDAQTQSYAVGGAGNSGDNIEGIEAVEWMQEWLSGPAPIGYCYGPPGAGKTNFFVLLARLWKRWAGEDAMLLSNIATLDDADKWVPSFASLERALEQQVDERDDGGIVQNDDAVPMMVVLDEASSDMSGRGSDGYDAGRLMGPLVYKIRKYNAGLLVVGHDGGDVHPAMRTLATVFQKQRGEQKTVRAFEDVRDREGRGHIKTLTGIPEAGGYDPHEATSWSWDEQGDRDDDEDALTLEEARGMAEDMTEDNVRQLAVALDEDSSVDIEQTEIARAVGVAYRGKPYKQSWVSKWKKRLRSEDAEDDD